MLVKPAPSVSRPSSVKGFKMAPMCCLAGIESDRIAMFTKILRDLGQLGLVHATLLNIRDLSSLEPSIVICDVDHGTSATPIEVLRQLRFVLPDSFIAVFTGTSARTWARSCHNAGVNCVILKSSKPAEISDGIRLGLKSGCFTDLHVDAA